MPDDEKQKRPARDWYLEQVYNDTDFRKEIFTLRKKLEDKYGKHVKLDQHHARKNTDLGGAELEEISYISKKYHLTLEELSFFADGYYFRNYAINRRDAVDIFTDKIPNKIVLTIGKDATFNDLKTVWPTVEWFKEYKFGVKRTKYKSPEYPEVIYGVLKQKQLGKKQSEIFSLYESGKLIKQSYNKKRFTTVESLIRYYNRYKPH